MADHVEAKRVRAGFVYIYPFFLRDFSMAEHADRVGHSLAEKWTCNEAFVENDYRLRPLLVTGPRFLLLERRPGDGGAGPVELVNGPAGTLSTSCKIRDSGAATVRFQIVFNREITLDELVKLADLERQHPDLPDPERPIAMPQASLYERFRTVAEDVARVAGLKTAEFHKFKIGDHEHCFLGKPVDSSAPAMRPYPIIWVAPGLEHYLTVRGLRWLQETEFVRAQEETEVASLGRRLLRIVLGALREGRDVEYCKSYELLDGEGRLKNFAPALRFFRNFSHRACLCMSPTLEDETHRDLFNMTVEVMECIWLKWHFHRLLNWLLDRQIQGTSVLLGRLEQLTSDPIGNEHQIMELLSRGSRERALFGTFKLRLLEDPAAHLMGSGSLDEMHDRAERIFSFTEAQRLLFDKSEGLDRVLDQVVEYVRTGQLQAMAREEHKLRRGLQSE